jgi:hypothetical protein
MAIKKKNKPKSDNYSNIPNDLVGHGGDVLDPTRVMGPGDPMTKLFANTTPDENP